MDRIDFEQQRPIPPIQEVTIVANTAVGVLRAIAILPRRLHVAVAHRALRPTSN
jgi:hypothetical protein